MAGLDEIKQWAMGLGPEAQVVSPQKLKEMVTSDLKKSLAQYEESEGIFYSTVNNESISEYGR